MIEINCTTGRRIPLDDIELYPVKLKKHSMLEIDRVEKSIRENGICFPITIGRINDHNYIIDGEATYFALKQMPKEEVPEIPVIFVRCNEERIKKMILISTSTNHCVTEVGLKKFVEGTNINLKEYSFNEGKLMDFYENSDILNIVFEDIKEKTEKYSEDVKKGLL